MTTQQPFEISNKRAMVSLGPLSAKRFCPYSCAFCYVHADINPYASWPIGRIINFLHENRSKYDVVYVSGDTDSFAEPRTEKGIDLLEALEELDCDILFTTRAPLISRHIQRIGNLSTRLKSKGKLLIGCVSITRLVSAPHIEPKPIPDPQVRIDVLNGLKSEGLYTVLAMRPFLPIIPVDEYLKIVSLSQNSIDLVLGEVWYCDKGGILEKQVFRGCTPDDLIFTEHTMDFNANKAIWKVWEDPEQQNTIAAYCDSINLPFFMRSRPAVLFLRKCL